MELKLASPEYVIEEAAGLVVRLQQREAELRKSADLESTPVLIRDDRGEIGPSLRPGDIWIVLQALRLRHRTTGELHAVPLFTPGILAITAADLPQGQVTCHLPTSLGRRMRLLDGRGGPIPNRSLSLIPHPGSRLTFDIMTDENGTFPAPGNLGDFIVRLHHEAPGESSRVILLP